MANFTQSRIELGWKVKVESILKFVRFFSRKVHHASDTALVPLLFPWCLNGEFMLQNCYMDFKRWYKWKSTAWVCKRSLLHLFFFFLGKGEWGLGEVAKNETRESQITGKIFKTRFSQTLIPVSLWSHFWKRAQLSHFLGSTEFFCFLGRDFNFGIFDISKISQGSFFFHCFVCSQQ